MIDHAGEGFVIGNERGDTVSGNQIFDNIITNSTGLRQREHPGRGDPRHLRRPAGHR